MKLWREIMPSITKKSKAFQGGFYAMGTRLEVLLPQTGHERGFMLVRMMQNETERLESILSVYRPESEISILNAMAGEAPVTVSKEVLGVLTTCADYTSKASGAFDIASGKMIAVEINPDDQRVYFKDETIQLDFGGFGKGYALQRLESLLRSFGVAKAFINFGDSAVLGIGTHPSGAPWKVGPRDPLNSGKALASFDLVNATMCTSGTIKNERQDGIQSHQHIIDPSEEAPVARNRLVAVVDEDPLKAEILSTAVLVNPEVRNNFQNSQYFIKDYD